MSDWRVANHYGHGAGRIAMPGIRHRHPATPDGLITGMKRAFDEAHGERNWLSHIVTLTPFVLFGLFIASNIALQMILEQKDHTSVEIVMLDFSELAPLPEKEPPPPPEPIVQKLAQAQPPPIPEPVARPQPQPRKPKPVEVAKLKPPPPIEITPPPPVPVIKPPTPIAKRAIPKPTARPRPRPKPQIRMDNLAMAPPPKAQPQSQTRRVKRDVETARRKVDLRPVAPVPTEAPTPTREVRPQRLAVQSQPRRTSRPAPIAPAMSSTPDLPSEAPVATRKHFTVAADSKSSRRPASDTALVPLAASDPQTFNEAPTPTRQYTVAAPKRRNSPPPTTSPAFQPTPALASDSTAATRSTRRAPQAAPQSRSSNVNLASVSVPTSRSNASTSPAAMDPEASTRSERVDALGSHSRSASADPSLQGVSLGSLAACITDAEEDSLKRKLVAAVTTQDVCMSHAGTYRFVETKNLNAFLMWIERAPSRAKADRCVELQLALDCLAQ